MHCMRMSLSNSASCCGVRRPLSASKYHACKSYGGTRHSESATSWSCAWQVDLVPWTSGRPLSACLCLASHFLPYVHFCIHSSHAQLVPESGRKQYTFRGLCVEKYDRGLRASFKLYNHYPGVGGFVQHLPLCAPSHDAGDTTLCVPIQHMGRCSRLCGHDVCIRARCC
jgi:hypothetical protein